VGAKLLPQLDCFDPRTCSDRSDRSIKFAFLDLAFLSAALSTVAETNRLGDALGVCG
jgi:hypothetical protein